MPAGVAAADPGSGPGILWARAHSSGPRLPVLLRRPITTNSGGGWEESSHSVYPNTGRESTLHQSGDGGTERGDGLPRAVAELSSRGRCLSRHGVWVWASPRPAALSPLGCSHLPAWVGSGGQVSFRATAMPLTAQEDPSLDPGLSFLFKDFIFLRQSRKRGRGRSRRPPEQGTQWGFNSRTPGS